MQKYIDRYCEVVLAGLNIQAGQKLFISGESCHWPVINTIAAHAYRRGIEYVEVRAHSPGLGRSRLENSREECLDYQPETIRAMQRVLVRGKWARLAISSVEDPDILQGIDGGRNIRMQRALRGAQEEYKQAVMSDVFNWTVCAVPTAGWAAKVFGGKPSGRLERKLWDELAPIYRLDRDDPAGAWREHCLGLSRRAARLNKLVIKELHFHAGEEPTLRVGLHAKALWKGGYSQSSTDIEFIPNLPTEEVFTTPDFRLTTGRVRLTRPAMIFDRSVEGVELEFKAGKVVRFSAEKNQDVLEGLLKSDEGAEQLGEIALVDSSSPIFKSGRIFQNILLDENAACHFAFGGAYPSCLQNGVGMSPAERRDHGINQSVIHTDVMIGSNDLNVDALTYSGKQLPLLVRGKFTEHAS